MGKKNLIIGAFSGYNYNQLKPWVESIDFIGDKVMIVGDTPPETMEELTKRGFTLIPMQKQNLPIHIARWVYVYDFLKANVDKYDLVVMTDLKDVYFQDDPFAWMRLNLGNKKLVVGSESLKYKDEAWGNQNLMDTFGPYVHDKFKDNEIWNVGVLGGKIDYLADMIMTNFLLAVTRPQALDQGTFNFIVNTRPYKDIMYFAKQHEGWACHAGTTVDPSKIETFRPHLLEKEPTYKDGIVYTSTGKKFCMVHQYDRVPEWQANVRAKFNQENPQDYFTYKV